MSEYRVTDRGVEIGRMNITSTGFTVLKGPQLMEVFCDLGDIMGHRVKAHSMGGQLHAELGDHSDKDQMITLVQRKLEGFGYTLSLSR
ncbi:hypothetical protein [Methanomassiliicoccus luminyensis]|jgi:hypothetical protein|uniref:hypothetical protein n=1 Tax=Methanomassiliicoccus luminyensis TaxID=1080712 RepID=UPI00037F7DD0|nr:hypothetical protein [Methanomassiliicoccus luminyensis]